MDPGSGDSSFHGSRSPTYDQDEGQTEAQCTICRRTFSLETETNEEFETISICRECKITVLNDNEMMLSLRDYHRTWQQRRRMRSRRRRYSSSESMEDLFLNQLSQLMDLARQNHDAPMDSEPSPTTRRIRRWQRNFSDSDSDVLYLTDSVFCESDSNISFSVYGGESEAGSFNSYDDDTDIDPMNAGLSQWGSEDEPNDDEEIRRGAPPASTSVVDRLTNLVISEGHNVICPVCKDPLLVTTEAKQLPCEHLYHPSCIVPWLSSRNLCPVCRFELPTDDVEYEEGKPIGWWWRGHGSRYPRWRHEMGISCRRSDCWYCRRCPCIVVSGTSGWKQKQGTEWSFEVSRILITRVVVCGHSLSLVF